MAKKFLNGIQIPQGAVNGYSLTSDASGNATWNSGFEIDNIKLLKTAVLTTPSSTSGNSHVTFDGLHTLYLYNPATVNSTLFKYDMNTKVSSLISNTLAEAYAGATVIYVGGYIYYTRGGGYNSFSRVAVDGTGFTALTTVPNNVNFAGALAWNGDDYIYLLHGSAFERYSISGNSWATMAAVPAGPTEGASITIVNKYIYAFRGAGTTAFWRYDIANNSWATMASTPGNVYDGGALGWNGGSHIYAFQGMGSQTFLRYSILSNVWETLQNLPVPSSSGSQIIPLDPGNMLFYVAEPAGITGFGVVNNLYLYTSHQTENLALKGPKEFIRVVHGATASVARPNATYVEWVGSVAPTNGTTVDTWVDTA